MLLMPVCIALIILVNSIKLALHLLSFLSFSIQIIAYGDNRRQLNMHKGPVDIVDQTHTKGFKTLESGLSYDML